MNRERRRRVANIIKQIEEVNEAIMIVKGEEEEALSNRPETLTYSEITMDMEDSINSLDKAERGLHAVCAELSTIV